MRLIFTIFDSTIKTAQQQGADAHYTLDLKEQDWIMICNFIQFLYNNPQVKSFSLEKK